MKPLRPIPVLMAVLAVAASACGDDHDPEPASSFQHHSQFAKDVNALLEETS